MKQLRKILVFLLLLFPLVLTGCDKEEHRPLDMNLIDGIWEVAEASADQVFPRGCMVKISTQENSISSSQDVLTGNISTFFITATGKPLKDMEYTWDIAVPMASEPIITVLDGREHKEDDGWKGSCFYRIQRLDSGYMWWIENSTTNKGFIQMRRRTDITLP